MDKSLSRGDDVISQVVACNINGTMARLIDLLDGCAGEGYSTIDDRRLIIWLVICVLAGCDGSS